MSSKVICVENLSKTYMLYDKPQDRLKQTFFRGKRRFYQEVEALKDVSFTINKGETVGIVGCNGSGKSTLLQLICGTVTPTLGTCTAHGRISALLELGAGFNPEFTGKENVYLNGAIMGMSTQELDEKYQAIYEFAGIGEMINQPVKTYSSGMYVRLAFAVAIASEPDILIVDEALAVGDERFQRKCFARIRQLQDKGTTILFVSHAASTIIEICDRALLMDAGELIYQGTPKQVVSYYQKMIYAPPEQMCLIREALQGLAIDEVLPEATIEASFITEGMTPESRIEYVSHGAQIRDPHIATLDGQPINILERGKRYKYQYYVEFEKICYGIVFGMHVKTKTGIELGGSGHVTVNEAIEQVEAGTLIEVSYEFTCSLHAGTYFLNAGCAGLIDGKRQPLHRIIDACMFKVAPESDLPYTGIVDFSITPSIEITNNVSKVQEA